MRDGEACLLRCGMRVGPHRQARPRRFAACLLRCLTSVEPHQLDHYPSVLLIVVPPEDAWLVLDDPVQELHATTPVGVNDPEFLAPEFSESTKVSRCKVSVTPAAPKSSAHTASMYLSTECQNTNDIVLKKSNWLDEIRT